MIMFKNIFISVDTPLCDLDMSIAYKLLRVIYYIYTVFRLCSVCALITQGSSQDWNQ